MVFGVVATPVAQIPGALSGPVREPLGDGDADGLRVNGGDGGGSDPLGVTHDWLPSIGGDLRREG
jgi:hypothetical protein